MEDRREKYQRKIEYILERIQFPIDKFDDNFYWDVLFYRMHTAIQALMDIIAMLCKDLGITVTDDYSNIEEMGKLNLLDEELIEKLRKLNGFRNVLVHRYNHIENTIVEDAKDEFISDMKMIVEKVEEILNDNDEFTNQ